MGVLFESKVLGQHFCNTKSKMHKPHTKFSERNGIKMKRLMLALLALCLTLSAVGCDSGGTENHTHISATDYLLHTDFEGKSFSYDGESYELPENALNDDNIGDIVDVYVLNNSFYLLIRASVNSGVSYFAVFDTFAEIVVAQFTATNVLWHSNTIESMISTRAGEVYNYKFELLGQYEFVEGDTVENMSFSEDNTKVNIEVKKSGGDIEIHTFDL